MIDVAASHAAIDGVAALHACGLRLRLGGLAVLRGIDLSLAPGARHALIGPNGAGKSTLIDVLSGARRADAGTIALGGDAVTTLGLDARARRGLARSFQVDALFPAHTPRQAMLLALAERDGHGARLWRGPRARTPLADDAMDGLARLRLDAVADTPIGHLPHGSRRVLDIALAMAVRPRVLLLDEPAAGVHPDERGPLFDALAALPEDVAVLFVEHDMDLVFRFAHRVTVLAEGEVIAEGAPAEVGADARVRSVYLGEAPIAGAPVADTRGHGVGMDTSAPLLSLRGVRAGHADDVVLDGVDLDLHAGERVALLGRNGAGKTTLIETLMGLTRVHDGALRWRKADMRTWTPARRAAAGLGWVPQGRDVFGSLTVDEHLAVAARPGRWTAARVLALFPSLHARRRHRAATLSGGEQQMLAIARALLAQPALLLLDEPMEGLAPTVVAWVAGAIREAADEGASVLVAEQQPGLALGITDRALVLAGGGIVHDGASAALRADAARQQALLGVTGAAAY